MHGHCTTAGVYLDVDGLSRRPDLFLMMLSATALLDPLVRKIADCQKKDFHARKFMQAALNPSVKSKWKVNSGLLLFTGADQLRIYVPTAMRNELIKEHHDNSISGHFGWRKVYAALQRWYYWDTMIGDIKAYVRACPACQLYKPTAQPTTAIVPSVPLSRPFVEISLDWVSGLPTTSNGSNCVLNIIDRFSKWAIVIPCTKTMTCAQLITLLWDKVFSWAGLPARIIGDRDTRLTAKQMRALAKGLNVRLALSASYRP